MPIRPAKDLNMSDKLELNQELIDSLKAISEIYNTTQRQAVTMLAGFIATNERDLGYMDAFMDPLYDFVGPQSDTEELLRKYINYISTFDSAQGKERADSLEDHLGYKMKIVYAAGLVAQRLHAGQIDKGGNDYFTGHLLNVAKLGFNWKERVTGFLHDAVEDCNVTVDEVMEMLDREIDLIVGNSQDSACEEDWWQDWMDEFMQYPAEQTHLLTDEERAQISETLNLMNHHTASTRSEYIARFKGHPLAIKTKLHDLSNNMDMSRIPLPTQKDLDRLARYRKEQARLLEMLNAN